jgi:hypothetical protein
LAIFLLIVTAKLASMEISPDVAVKAAVHPAFFIEQDGVPQSLTSMNEEKKRVIGKTTVEDPAAELNMRTYFPG